MRFQSTLSVRRATTAVSYVSARSTIFQSTLSVRRATSDNVNHPKHYEFQSTLSVRRATFRMVGIERLCGISIHALREESDASTVRDGSPTPVISIHALREESDCAAGHFCPLFETQASCLALRISNNTAGTTNNIPKTSNWLSVSFLISTI